MASQIDITIMNMSVGRHTRTVLNKETGNMDTVEVSAQERKIAIVDILKCKQPKLVFVQEFTWTGLHVGNAFEELVFPEYYRFLGNSDSGFIYDERCLFCERLDNKSSLRRSYGLFIAQHSSEPYFDLSRLCLCKIKSVGPPEFELLCACWHGPHKKYKNPRKRNHLHSLLKFLLKIKAECGNLPLLLGGDFNLESDKVNGVCEDMFNKLVMLQPKTQGSIMLWVQSDDFNKVFRLADPNNDLNEEPYHAFDHDVLTMKLQIATTVEVLKRSHGLYYDYKRDPIVKKTYYVRYHLNVREMTETEDYPSFQMMSASWHGADAEYSDETKKDSLKSAITFLQLVINKQCIPKPDMIYLNWKGVVRDSSTAEKMHSGYNTLDSWIFSSDKTSLDELKRKFTNLKDIKLVLHNSIASLFDRPLGLTPQQRHTPNGAPVDIHLEIVNMVLSHPEKKCIVTGYLHKCIYLSANDDVKKQ